MKVRKLPPKMADELVELLGSRVTFDRIDRICYSHDVGSMPGFIRMLLGDTTPAAVVQPQSEEELLALVAMAGKYGVPLVPRGKSTSGYGGVIPTRGGIVVDFWRMRGLLSVDEDAMTATVEPGIVFAELDRQLAGRSLAMTTYPSSAPSATLGGWLAQGGAGFGATQSGTFRENVVSARVVHFDGTVREYTGADLDLVSDAEGVTGMITKLTVRLRKLEPEAVLAAAFDTPEQVAAAIERFMESGVPVWSLSFTNPEMAKLRNDMPRRTKHGKVVEEERHQSTVAYTLVCVFPESRRSESQPAFESASSGTGGRILPEEEARIEWSNRFNIMMVKKLGPSLIPAESIIPASGLAQYLNTVRAKVKHLVIKEGVVVAGNGRKPEIVVLGFIPHDERTFGFTPAFALSLTILKAAKAAGGRAYSTGLYFKHEAGAILGADRVERMKEMKKRTDPKGLLNPDKVLGSPGLIGWGLKMGMMGEPVARIFANLFRVEPGEKNRGSAWLPEEVERHAYSCAQCGYCVDSCDEFYGRGWESHAPRGKWYLLRQVAENRIQMSQEIADRMLVCTTCEMCNNKCPVELPIEPDWLTMRGELVHRKGFGTFPPFEMMGAALGNQGNIWAGTRATRDDWVDEDIASAIDQKSDIAYFAGCTASYVEQEIAKGTAKLLRDAGVRFSYLGREENCCGIPMLMAGKWTDWEKNMRRNVENMKNLGAKTVVTSCPACWLVWHHFYPEWCKKLGIPYDFKAVHYSEVLAEKLADGTLKFDKPLNEKITWHDSCHMGRAGGIYEPPRELIKAIPGVELVEMAHNREEGYCCGSVLTLIREPDVAADIGCHRLKEAEDVHADGMAAACPCCQFQLRVSAEKCGSKVKVYDLAALLARAKGYDLPDPHPVIQASWAVFDAMIALMTVDGFADVMTELFPQFAKVMPLPMRAMISVMKILPEPLRRIAFAPMKPMLPLMFPFLAPGMMAKVFDDMLAVVGRKVPMPEHMRQLMPKLMPEVMDNLLPHLLPGVAAKIAGPMVDYLRTGKTPAATGPAAPVRPTAVA